jgi:hypothetical protein
MAARAASPGPGGRFLVTDSGAHHEKAHVILATTSGGATDRESPAAGTGRCAAGGFRGARSALLHRRIRHGETGLSTELAFVLSSSPLPL